MIKRTIKTVVFGNENLEGNLIPAPIDEKNLVSDWIEEFLFQDLNGCVSNGYDEVCGYVSIPDCSYESNMLCVVSYYDNHVFYKFPNQNWIDKDDVNSFVSKLEEFFKENELTINVITLERETGSYEPEITLDFYFREEC